jgi:transcriptional regulator with XRE-family HTH domain
MASTSGDPRAELRSFLRAARARVEPRDLGIPGPARRRTRAGLRIEDLCAVAGVGITWYSALESGKPVNVSRQLLGTIADALRLSDDERHYIYSLVEREEPERKPPDGSIRRTLERLVRSIEVGPAMLIDERWTVLAFNDLGDLVYGLSSRPAEDNFAERMFLDDAFRSLHLDWEMNARKLVGTLKMTYAFAHDRRGMERWVRKLRDASSDFRALWDEPVVEEQRPKIARLNHPTLGKLTLEFVGLQQAERWRGRANDTVLLQIPVAQTGTQEALLKASSARLPALPDSRNSARDFP